MTIKDIAKLSGYGIGTVSRVLNNQPGVSEKAKEKILKIIEESNYEPNANARNLKMRSGSCLGFIIKGNNNMLFADILERMQITLSDWEENTEVEYIDEDGDEVAAALKMCRDRVPKGIFFLGANKAFYDERFKEISVPCVVVTTDCSEININNLSSIAVDDAKASYTMIDYLIKKGHREIGVIGGNLSATQISYTRVNGCVDAFKDNGISYDRKKNFEPSRYSMEGGYQATKRLLERNPDITALFCFADTIAIGAMRAIADMGKRVPEDISVAGFDGIALSKFSVPRLTTVIQDSSRMASRGVDILLKHTHYESGPDHEIIPFDVIEGDSVREI